MAAICGYNQKEITIFSIAGALDVAAGTGATWLVSSATTSLVGGALGGIAHLVSVLVLPILDNFECAKGYEFKIFLALELSMPVVLSFAATALGYPVSIPLALLIGVINVAAFFAADFITK